MCCQEGARLDGDGDIFEMAEDESLLTADFLYLGFATLVFWKSLFKSKPYMSRRCRIQEYAGEKCLLAKIMYENSFYECGQRIKFSLLRRMTQLRKFLKPFFVSEI